MIVEPGVSGWENLALWFVAVLGISRHMDILSTLHER